jgi:hypothetical protein
MKKITSTAELKKAILVLEEKQALQGQLLKEQCQATCESLKPVNIIKNLFSNLTASPDLRLGIIAAAVSLTSFYLVKKTMARSTRNPVRKLFGNLFLSGVSSIVTQHHNTIKSVGQVLFQHVFHKKEDEPKKPC